MVWCGAESLQLRLLAVKIYIEVYNLFENVWTLFVFTFQFTLFVLSGSWFVTLLCVISVNKSINHNLIFFETKKKKEYPNNHKNSFHQVSKYNNNFCFTLSKYFVAQKKWSL